MRFYNAMARKCQGEGGRSLLHDLLDTTLAMTAPGVSLGSERVGSSARTDKAGKSNSAKVDALTKAGVRVRGKTVQVKLA